jgi:uncharacterized protein (TIGR00661 family)
MKKILYGVCGIANGHTYRQLPVLDHLAKSNKIMIFAYGDSLRFLSAHFAGHVNVKVVEVAVPYYVGNRTGIDFDTSAKLAAESGINHTEVNIRALATASAYLGVADLVVSDYEPVCAQYAYAYNIPLVTIDQQSKYLSGDFPKELHGQTYTDEVVRLRMFFPVASARLACSFFAVNNLPGTERVLYYPPVLRTELSSIASSVNRKPNVVLVYLTAQKGLRQSPLEVLDVLTTQEDVTFHVFTPTDVSIESSHLPNNITMHTHGEDAFQTLLGTCTGIVATAGHSLLSEAMYLGIPVLALPLQLYEQQMNAEVIDANNFGISAQTLTPEVLGTFVSRLPVYAKNIENDTSVLLRGDGQSMMINFLEKNFLE